MASLELAAHLEAAGPRALEVAIVRALARQHQHTCQDALRSDSPRGAPRFQARRSACRPRSIRLCTGSTAAARVHCDVAHVALVCAAILYSVSGCGEAKRDAYSA